MGAVDSPIAERHYTLVGPDGAHSSVVVRLGIPHTDGPCCQCPYEIQGLGNTYTRVCIAADSIQALQLVMIMIGAELDAYCRTTNSQLNWNGGNDLGFPLQ